MSRKDEILTYIGRLGDCYARAESLCPDLLAEPRQRFEKHSEGLRKDVAALELVVPVVGGFSAGKSTALNNLLGGNILPVKVTAETAIPAELRYSLDESIVAETTTGNTEEHPVTALPELSARAEHYEVVKLYLDRPFLREFETFTLVDMPGYDSPLATHERAILRYLGRGAHYLYLVSVTDGGLRRDDLRRIGEILDTGKSVDMIMTKLDLVPPPEADKVEEFVRGQLAGLMGKQARIYRISDTDVSALRTLLGAVDPDRLFDQLCINQVKELYFQVNADLMQAMASLRKSHEDSDAELQELEKARSSLLFERDRQVETIRDGLGMRAGDRISARLEHALHGEIEYLATAARRGEEGLHRAVSEIVRATLVKELSELASGLSTSIVRSCADQLDPALRTQIHLGEDWMRVAIESLGQQMLHSLTSAVPNSGPGKASVGIAGTLSAVALLVPHPVLRVVLAALPGLIGALFIAVQEQRQRAQLLEAVSTQVIPSVIRQIRPEIERAIDSLIDEGSAAINTRFQQRIDEHEAMLRKAQSAHEVRAGEWEAAADSLKLLIDEVNALTTKTLHGEATDGA